MARLDETNHFFSPVQGAHHAVNTVAGKAVNPPHAPVIEALDEIIVGCLCQGSNMESLLGNWAT